MSSAGALHGRACRPSVHPGSLRSPLHRTGQLSARHTHLLRSHAVCTLGTGSGKFKQVRLVTSEDVLRAEVPWPTFQSAGIITKEQLEMIYQLDKQSVETKLALFHKVSRRERRWRLALVETRCLGLGYQNQQTPTLRRASSRSRHAASPPPLRSAARPTSS